MLIQPGSYPFVTYILVDLRTPLPVNVTIFYSFPHELAPLRRRLFAVPVTASACKTFRAEYGSHRLLLIETGMGQMAAKRAILSHVAGQKPDVVISAGFCGALSRDIPIGTVVRATEVVLCNGTGVIDSLRIPPTIDHLEQIPVPVRAGTMVTLEQQMKKQVVRGLLSCDFTLTVCDMESYYLAEMSLGLGISFVAIRSVSDSARNDIPRALFTVCSDLSGAYSVPKAASVLVANPLLIPKILALGLHARSAGRQLSQALIALLDFLP